MSGQRKTSLGEIAIGIGCDRAATTGEMLALVESCLAEASVDRRQVTCIATIDIKLAEPGLTDLAQQMNLPLRGFPALILEAETPRLATPSDAVYRAIGCHGVAEAAALAAIGPAGVLLLAKRRATHVTCALAGTTGVIAGTDMDIERTT